MLQKRSGRKHVKAYLRALLVIKRKEFETATALSERKTKHFGECTVHILCSRLLAFLTSLMNQILVQCLGSYEAFPRSDRYTSLCTSALHHSKWKVLMLIHVQHARLGSQIFRDWDVHGFIVCRTPQNNRRVSDWQEESRFFELTQQHIPSGL